MEIPVIHETSVTSQSLRLARASSPSSYDSQSGKPLQIMTSSTPNQRESESRPLSPTTNQFLLLSKTPKKQSRHQTTNIISGRKPPAPAQRTYSSSQLPVSSTKSPSSLSSADDVFSPSSSPSSVLSSPLFPSPSSSSSPSTSLRHPRSFHVRLPSTDSGIQVDSSGFDSLSRYKGKNFMSSSFHGDLTTNDDPQAGRMTSSLHGASGDNPYKLYDNRESSIHGNGSSPRGPSLSSPLTSPLTVSISSSRSSPTSRPLSPSNNLVVAPQNSPRSSPISHAVNITETPGCINITFGDSNSRTKDPYNPGNTTNQNKVSPPSSVNSQRSAHHPLFNQNVNTSGAKSTPLPHNGSRTVPISVLTAPGSTLRFRSGPEDVTRTATEDHTLSQGQHHQGSGSVVLTRPLKVATSPKLKVTTIKPFSSGGGSHQATPLSSKYETPQPLPYESFPRQNKPLPPQKPKPEIAHPKPFAKPRSMFNKSLNRPLNAYQEPTKDSQTGYPQSKSESPEHHSVQKPSVLLQRQYSSPATSPRHNSPVPSSKKMNHPTNLCHPKRMEIPVRHEVSCTASLRGSSNDRLLSPTYEPYRRKNPIDRIYEDVKLIRDSFKFDDDETRQKHAELIMKHSGDLINDALKMFGDSRLESFGDSNLDSKHNKVDIYPLEERFVEGAEQKVPINEHMSSVKVANVAGQPSNVSSESGKTLTNGRHHKENSSLGKRPNVEPKEKSVDSQRGSPKRGSTESETPEMTGSCASWAERKERMDGALSWLREELADLRKMDTTLISQFQRCQATIETLKCQREVWEGLEEEEEGEYWDDTEINDFNRHYMDSPSGSSCSQFSPGSSMSREISRDRSLHDVTSLTFPVPPRLPLETNQTDSDAGVAKASSRRSTRSVSQDVEASL